MAYPSATPTIIKHIPESNQYDVATDISIDIVFSNDMDRDTLHPGTFSIYQNNSLVYGSVEYDAETNTASFIPYDPLKKGVKYTVIISQDVTDVSGVSLNNTYTFEFTTDENDDLPSPNIIYPNHQSEIDQAKIVWEKVDNAEVYEVQVAKDSKFNDIVYSNNFLNDNQLIIENNAGQLGVSISVLEAGNQYYTRVKAIDVLYDTVTTSFQVDNSKISYYSDSERKLTLDKKYRPIEAVNSFEIIDVNGISQQLNVTDDIEINANEGEIVFNYYGLKIEAINLEIDFGIKMDNSVWSEVHSFYYVLEQQDFKEAILSQTNADMDLVEINYPEERYNLEITEINFTVYDDVTLEDITVSLTGQSINRIPYIESHGEVLTTLTLTTQEESYSVFTLVVDEPLLVNNDFILKVDVKGSIEKFEFMSPLDPLYNTVDSLRNSKIGALVGDIEDKIIYLKLYSNSVLVDELLARNDEEVGETPAIEVMQYVLAKTARSLLFQIYLNRSSSKSIRLSDFEVESFDYEEIQPILDELKLEIEYWKDLMQNSGSLDRARPTSALTGPEYPLGSRQI